MKRGVSRWERLCEVCLGDGCRSCFMKGWVSEHIAPDRMIDSPAATMMFAHYRYFIEHKLLPGRGGVNKQPSLFRWMIEFCAAVHGVYAEREAREAEEKARIDKQKRARHNGH